MVCMENKMRGQISAEILILVGLMMALLVPLLLYSYGRANTAKEDLSVQKAEFAAQRLASLANSVGYLGGDAAIIEEIELPSDARSIRVQGSDIVMGVVSSSGRQDIVKTTDFVLEGSGLDKITSGGNYFIEVRAVTNFTQGTRKVKLTLT